jgi:sugar phosphate isomerase/epimerase
MRLSFYTYSYTDRLMQPTVDCLERIARTGYSGIDVSGTHGPSDDPASFDADLRKLTRQTAERLNLRIEAVITHADLTGSLFDPARKPLDLVGTVDLAVALGAPVVTFHMGGYPPDIDRDIVWKRTAEAIRQAADYGIARHVDLAVDGIWPEWIDDSPDALSRLFDDVGAMNFGVNFDPCYLTLIDVDPAAFARRFSGRIAHAHLKDHRGAYPKWEHFFPGRGEMDYVAVFRALKEIDFQGAAAVECFTDMPLAEACDDGFTAMTTAADKAGVKFAR